GETVTWSNDDTAAHTVTSGSAAGGADGVFDSGLFTAGTTFSQTFEEEGTFDYFCMVHPWMVGSVTVGTTASAEKEDDMKDKDNDETHEMEDKDAGETILKSMSSDGTIEVNVEAYDPMTGQGMELEVEFYDVASSSQVEHINYDIMATQNGKTVLSEMGIHQHSGAGEHMTEVLDSDDPVDVSVTIQGIGVDPPFTGPQGDTIEFTVVPEFGTIAMMVLAVAIISIVAISARSRLSIMPRL
ncbi:MAG: PEFG-CTERM sorting domain-containing protein, partial [Nitrosopumilus sp.]